MRVIARSALVPPQTTGIFAVGIGDAVPIAEYLGRGEFNRWFDLSADVLTLLCDLLRRGATVPTLHVMGARDRMFLRGTLRLASDARSSTHVIDGVGPVCNVEAASEFNTIALSFLRRADALGGQSV